MWIRDCARVLQDPVRVSRLRGKSTGTDVPVCRLEMYHRIHKLHERPELRAVFMPRWPNRSIAYITHNGTALTVEQLVANVTNCARVLEEGAGEDAKRGGEPKKRNQKKAETSKPKVKKGEPAKTAKKAKQSTACKEAEGDKSEGRKRKRTSPRKKPPPKKTQPKKPTEKRSPVKKARWDACPSYTASKKSAYRRPSTWRGVGKFVCTGACGAPTPGACWGCVAA